MILMLMILLNFLLTANMLHALNECWPARGGRNTR